ncbi:MULTISPECIES: hypothetical protein [Actinoalloteichus]|uniref:GerMN domain-containing protein n=1 Tax=Actinoalloteichus fjordicus TaxID=1612552 RepID=A0AAC9LF83_9PSEU|nr:MULTISPECIES: hypothetical protein [Actinoalloteichus]APU16833.1 hypothetical protein UA74_24075 [Actinoalloteichus fjordicus]APU22898.1 hypothetical protein UA75_24580 [Actinoalloteichus sp. GBA129-24]
MRRRFLLVGALLMLAVTGIEVPPVAAQTASGHTADITVSPTGITAPDTLPTGSVTLDVSTNDPDGAWLVLVRLNPDMPLETYLDNLRTAYGDDEEAALVARRSIAAGVQMLGGAILSDIPASVTTIVTPGVHYLVDIQDATEPDLAERVRPVRVVPVRAEDVSQPQQAPALLTMVDTEDGPRFRVPERLVANRPIIMLNRGDQPYEAILAPVRPGTTPEDLDEFFGSLDDSRPAQTQPPFIGDGTGSSPLSPDRLMTFEAELPPGDYAIISWVADLATGRISSALGLHALVTIVDPAAEAAAESAP